MCQKGVNAEKILGKARENLESQGSGENTARDLVARDMHTGDLVETGSLLSAEPTPLVGGMEATVRSPRPYGSGFPQTLGSFLRWG